jgi:hypothetical protein
MISAKDQRIPPLTRERLPTVPWFLKWLGWVNNRWNESMVDAVLARRDQRAVIDTWEGKLPGADLVAHVLAAIGNEIGWKNPLFIPQDECFVVLKLWWHGVADCWERERCMWAIERILGKRPPSSMLPTIANMTLGDLLAHFQDGEGTGGRNTK